MARAKRRSRESARRVLRNGDLKNPVAGHHPVEVAVSAGSGALLLLTLRASFTMIGNGSFHHDLSLANMNGNPLFQPSKWVELVSASGRATYASQLP